MIILGHSYYKRFYRLVAAAVAVMTAILTGSLVLGDSVRESLVERVYERLGNTETIIFAGNGFLEHSVLDGKRLTDAKGYLLVDGFVSVDGKMIPVTVWGTDSDGIDKGEITVNEQFANTVMDNGMVVLHLPSNNLVGTGSLFVSKNYATQLRLRIKGIKGKQEGGNILLRHEQMRPLNVFINRRDLAEALEIGDKINVILSPTRISSNDFKNVWMPRHSGLHLTDSIVSVDRLFLPQSVVNNLNPSARFLAYFVNSIGNIPYSFVTATSLLNADETILSDYTAERLNAQIGDTVTMDYYVSHGALKHLETRTHRFRVKEIVPISFFQQQSKLITADFPGLSGVSKCTDWESDLPIDMSRISKEDEAYWEHFRQLPKALVSYDAMVADWSGPFGVATKAVVRHEQLNNLSYSDFGVSIVHPREDAILAAQNGTDFGSLFLALGIFIMIAAILLMQSPLSEMYQLRYKEIQLYSMLGFSNSQIFKMLFIEALPVVLTAAPVGVMFGFAYASLILWLLAGPWSGATHTDGFNLYLNLLTVIISFFIALILAIVVLSLVVRRAFRQNRQKSSKPQNTSFLRASLYYYRHQHRLSFWTIALGIFVVFSVGLNRPDFSHSSQKATGGYQFYGECRFPIQYDMNTTTGRHHLHLDGIPVNNHFLQIPKHTENEASCLNLNKVEMPSVLGMSLKDMVCFGIDTLSMKKLDVVPVAIDEESLLWSMMKEVGDTIVYHTGNGTIVPAVIAASYPTGIFHGNAIMPIDYYQKLWPDEMGTRVLLGNTSDITIPLSDYGITVMPTSDRLRLFFEVTDAYLSIFMSLGGLGMLLGLVSLMIVIRKNLAARREEIHIYRSLGYPKATIVRHLRKEQAIIPLLAILAGAICSLFSIITNVGGAGRTTWYTAISLFIFILLTVMVIIHLSINSKTIQQCETN